MTEPGREPTAEFTSAHTTTTTTTTHLSGLDVPQHWWERAWRLWVPLTIALGTLALSLVGWVLVQSLRTNAQQAACARRLAANVIDADHEWFDAASAVLGGEFADRTAVQKRFIEVKARQSAAVGLARQYAAHPTPDCPVTPAELTTQTTPPTTVVVTPPTT